MKLFLALIAIELGIVIYMGFWFVGFCVSVRDNGIKLDQKSLNSIMTFDCWKK